MRAFGRWPRRAAGIGLVVLVAALAVAGVRVSGAVSQATTGGLAITWPANGQAVPGPNVLVAWQAPGVSLSMTADQGRHADFIVDGVVTAAQGQAIPRQSGVVRTAENPAVIPNLSPGSHSVQLVLVDGSDMPVSGLQPTVSFTVLTPHPADIYAGTCDNLNLNTKFALNVVGSGVANPLTTSAQSAVISGTASTSAVQAVTVSNPMPVGSRNVTPVEVSDSIVEVRLRDLLASPHAIAVHASRNDLSTILVCGNIGGPVYQQTLRLGLAEVNGSGYVGVATLADEGTQIHAVVELVRIPRTSAATPLASPTTTATATVTATATTTATTTVTATATATSSVPTATPAETPTSAATATPTATPTDTPTAAPTDTSTAVPPTDTPTPTDTPQPTNTPEPTPAIT